MSKLAINLSRWARSRFEKARTFHDKERMHKSSEVGDTLVEVLLALIVIGLTCTAVLGAFATTLEATIEHRNLATNDAVLRSFAETAKYDIWLSPNPAYVACALTNQYQSIASSYPVPSGFKPVKLTVTQYLPATATNGCTNSPTAATLPTAPTQPQPQMLEATVTSSTGSDKLDFVVSDPHVTNSTSISPSIAPSGTTVVITGTDLSNASQVNFGSTTIPSTSFVGTATATQVSVKVPTGGSGSVPVTVTTPNGTSQSVTFTYFAVTAISSPAPTGASVTITGSGFTGASQVDFGTSNIMASNFTVNGSGTQITLTVPAGTNTANVSVVNGTYTSNSVVFTYLALNSISPTAAPVGKPVTLTGTGFTNASKVTFGSVSVGQGSFTVNGAGTTITLNVPSGNTGTVSVSVTNGSYTSNTVTFTYFSLSSITTPAPSGASVTINGNGLTGSTQVNFGSTTIPSTSFITNGAGTQISLTAPSGTGTVSVSVVNAGVTSNSVSFTYLALTGVSPSPAAAGTSVTISGTGLTGTTQITFGSTSITTGFTVNGAGTQITVPVPTNSAGGTVNVTVTNNGFTSNAAQFTYLQINSFNPSGGTKNTGISNLQIVGSGFSGATNVLWNATNIPSTQFTVNGTGTMITLNAPSETKGTYTVTVTAANGQTCSSTFKYS